MGRAMTSAEIIALAKSIPHSVNLLDEREVNDCIVLELCVEYGIRQSSIEPYLDAIKATALADRLSDAKRQHRKVSHIYCAVKQARTDALRKEVRG
jgi:isochorismate hydrolase